MNICITGVSKGVGKELVKELVQKGHFVWGAARSEEGLKNLEQEIGNSHFRYSCIDVADIGSITSWVSGMKAEAFEPDIVILCASIYENDMQDSYDHSKGHEVIKTNLEGPLQCVEALLPNFVEKRKGRFVVITSTSAHRPSRKAAAYCASKAGIDLAFRSFQIRFASSGIQFARVTMGPVATGMWHGKKGLLIPSPDKAAKKIAKFALSNRAHFYYPFASTMFLRMTRVLSDKWFVWISNKLAG